MTTRRNFIKQTMVATAGLALTPSLTFGVSQTHKAQKLKLAFIGVGPRGMEHVRNTVRRRDVEITAICDIDPNAIKTALKEINKFGYSKPMIYDKNEEDYKNLLDWKTFLLF